MTNSEPSKTQTPHEFPERLRHLVEEVVRPCFLRCMKSGDEFFDDFYATLSDKAPGIGAMFAHVDMLQQNRLIRRGIEHLMNFAVGSEESRRALLDVGQTHGRQGLDVAPELYPVWVDTLMETVRSHDPDANDNVEAAWRVVLRGGIDLITSRY